MQVCMLSCFRHVWLFTTPRTAAWQTPLSSNISQSLLKFMSIMSMMLFNHLILCHPLLLPSTIPRFRVFSMSHRIIWTLFGLALWDWNENWPFLILWPLLSFPNLLTYWVQHLTASFILKSLLTFSCMCYLLSHIQLFLTPWTVTCQAPLSMGFSRQEYRSRLPFPSPTRQ